MVKVSAKNSSILNLARREPKFKNGADRILMYTFADDASSQDKKDKLSPSAKQDMKELVHLTDIVCSSKKDCSTMLDVVQNYHDMHWKKLFRWYVTDTGITAGHTTKYCGCRNVLPENAIKAISTEINIIFGMVHEHDDFILSQMKLQTVSGEFVRRAPEREWHRFFEHDITDWMLSRIRSIVDKNVSHKNVCAAAEKLPLFVEDTKGLTVPSLILGQTKRQIAHTQSYLLRKTLEYFFLRDRKSVVSQFFTGYYLGSSCEVQELLGPEREFIKRLYVSACHVEIRECINEYNTLLSKSYEGYDRHCIQIVYEKLKNKAFTTTMLVERAHKLFLNTVIIENIVHYRALIHQAMRNVPIRMKDRLINEAEACNGASTTLELNEVIAKRNDLGFRTAEETKDGGEEKESAS